MPGLTVVAQDINGVEKRFQVSIDRGLPIDVLTPYTFDLVAGSHYVEVLFPQPLGPNLPYWVFRKWVDLLGNTIGLNSELSIDLTEDATVICVAELVQPLPIWAIPVAIGLVIAVPSIYLLYRYFSKKR